MPFWIYKNIALPFVVSHLVDDLVELPQLLLIRNVRRKIAVAKWCAQYCETVARNLRETHDRPAASAPIIVRAREQMDEWKNEMVARWKKWLHFRVHCEQAALPKVAQPPGGIAKAKL